MCRKTNLDRYLDIFNLKGNYKVVKTFTAPKLIHDGEKMINNNHNHYVLDTFLNHCQDVLGEYLFFGDPILDFSNEGVILLPLFNSRYPDENDEPIGCILRCHGVGHDRFVYSILINKVNPYGV